MVNFKDLLHNLVEDDSPAPAAAPEPTPVPQQAPPTFDMGLAAVAVPPVEAAPVDQSDDVYRQLASKTDYTVTPVFQLIQKYAKPLISLPMDDKTRFKVAVSQAQAIEHLDPTSVTNVFEEFLNLLVAEKQRFDAAMAKALSDQVDGKKAQALEINKQIAQLQAQAQQLSDDAFAAQQRIQAAEHRFEQALQTRHAELAAEQSKYTNLLA